MKRLVIGLAVLFVLAGTGRIAPAVTVQELSTVNDALLAVDTPPDGDAAVDMAHGRGFGKGESEGFRYLCTLLDSNLGSSLGSAAPVEARDGQGRDSGLPPDGTASFAKRPADPNPPEFDLDTGDVAGPSGVARPADGEEQPWASWSLWRTLHSTGRGNEFVTLTKTTMLDDYARELEVVPAPGILSGVWVLVLLALVMIAPAVAGLVIFLRRRLRAMGVI